MIWYVFDSFSRNSVTFLICVLCNTDIFVVNVVDSFKTGSEMLAENKSISCAVKSGILGLAQKRFVLLKHDSLTIHKRRDCVDHPNYLIFFEDIERVERTDQLDVSVHYREKGGEKKISLIFEEDDDVFRIMDCKSEISKPSQFKHLCHVGYNHEKGEFTGLPAHWHQLLKGSKINKADVEKDPENVLNVLEFYTSTKDNDYKILKKDRPQKPDLKENIKPDLPKKRRKMTFEEMVDQLVPLCNPTDPHKCYTLIKKLGQGASGSVYLAKYSNRANSIYMAIKRIHLKNQPRKELIINELNIIKTFRHPNLVEFVDSHYLKGDLYVVMEYMNCSLTNLIDYHTKNIKTSFKENEMACIIYETLQGISFLHSKEVIHRDIKSDNILLDKTGHIKLSILILFSGLWLLCSRQSARQESHNGRNSILDGSRGYQTEKLWV
eukprot:NODE_8_length_66115_cov_0.981823.p15 type:complete len:437 gc:universal NODE_8_length_66115_cov_0.981823:45523-44213(-)